MPPVRRPRPPSCGEEGPPRKKIYRSFSQPFSGARGGTERQSVQKSAPEAKRADPAAERGARERRAASYHRAAVSYTDLSEKRIAEAKRLLRGRAQLPIGQIAAGVGFSDVNYFTKVFKKKAGQTPKMCIRDRRRIIHSAISEMEGVKSESIGEGANRRVVISSTNPSARPPRDNRCLLYTSRCV